MFVFFDNRNVIDAAWFKSKKKFTFFYYDETKKIRAVVVNVEFEFYA